MQGKKHSRRILFAAMTLSLVFGVAACSSTSNTPVSGNAASTGFPVTIHAANGAVTIASKPMTIVSLSPSSTDMLYAIGAGAQVTAVDSYSNYPAAAVPKMTKLDGYSPNVEAIVAHHPDLVLEDAVTGLPASLAKFKIPVLNLPAAATLADEYQQFTELGAATGHVAQAAAEVSQVKNKIAAIVKATPKPSTSLTYYYELDQTYYSATSQTFIGSLFSMFGLHNIADEVSTSADGGYPQLTSEYIVKENPSFIFLADTICCQQTPATIAARPGWSHLQAVTNHDVVPLNDYIASQWGTRVPELLQDIASALTSEEQGKPTT